ncbi:MAG: hypothetical protein BBJ57_03050 [Desulfobacterales bacterium PC51MH44]|nr:MAG: hypothetical protein BBJ57_03050 [Desulfobacterales bacterium PC51MH44]
MGRPIHNLNPNKIVSFGISQVPEGRRIFPYLSVMENLDSEGHIVNALIFTANSIEGVTSKVNKTAILFAFTISGNLTRNPGKIRVQIFTLSCRS